MKYDQRRPAGPKHSRAVERKEGMVLFATMGILALLAALALVVLTVTRIDFRIARNHIEALRAIYEADSGIQFAKAEFEERLSDGETMLDIAANANVSPPSGFTFDPITRLDQLANTNLYRFTSTGRSGSAQTTVEATIKRAEALGLGLFGDLEVEMYPGVGAYSYDGDLMANPMPEDSTGEAAIGSNEQLTVRPNVTVDGLFVVGEDEFGAMGTYPDGAPIEERARIEPDPLGAISGSLAADFVAVRANNDNASCPSINGTRMILRNHTTTTITAGNYYLTEVEIANHSALLADATAGPVNIFLSGEFHMAPDGDLNTAGMPSGFRIFSDSSAPILLKPKGDANCFIYAPDASVQVYPNGDFHGVIWAERVDLKPGGTIWIDTSLLNKIKSHRIVIVSWKELRG